MHDFSENHAGILHDLLRILSFLHQLQSAESCMIYEGFVRHSFKNPPLIRRFSIISQHCSCNAGAIPHESYVNPDLIPQSWANPWSIPHESYVNPELIPQSWANPWSIPDQSHDNPTFIPRYSWVQIWCNFFMWVCFFKEMYVHVLLFQDRTSPMRGTIKEQYWLMSFLKNFVSHFVSCCELQNKMVDSNWSIQNEAED